MVRVRNTEKTARSRPANLLLLHKYSIAQLRVTQRNSCHSNTKGTIYLERLRTQPTETTTQATQATQTEHTAFRTPETKKRVRICVALRVASRETRASAQTNGRSKIPARLPRIQTNRSIASTIDLKERLGLAVAYAYEPVVQIHRGIAVRGHELQRRADRQHAIGHFV